MKKRNEPGFTLIELLTVIAIIAILASMVFVAGPRILERVKIASWTNTCNQIRTTCVGYYTKYKDTYPPGYGYRVSTLEPGQPIPETSVIATDSMCFNTIPYLARTGIDYFGNLDVYDSFSQSGDTDRLPWKKGLLSLLEFSPVGSKDSVDQTKYWFPTTLYRVTNYNPYTANLTASANQQGSPGRTMGDELNAQLAATRRPMIYVPVNRNDALNAVKYWRYVAIQRKLPKVGWYAECWDLNLADPKLGPLPTIKPGPRKYDDFVLISVGPGNSTNGLVTPPQGSKFVSDLLASGIAPEDLYYYFALRTYFLATRDANNNGQGNGLWDFDFRNRSRKAEAKTLAPEGLDLLPDGTQGYGPLIYLPNDSGVH